MQTTLRTLFKATAAVALLAATGTAALAADPAKKEIVIGTTVGDFGDQVKQAIRPILEKKGYKVKLVEFTDYIRPNLALQEGSLDVNVFQHRPYLDTFSAQHKLQLSPVFQVPTAPLGVYAGRTASLAAVKNGSSVSIPNDPSNLARALVMLNDLGWIKLKAGINPLTASERDIATNVKQIKLRPLEAAQLPRSRADVDFAVVNGNYAVSSGMKLTSALYQEKSDAYINVGAIKTSNANTQWAKDVIAAYQSPEFKAYSLKRFPGYKYPASWNVKK